MILISPVERLVGPVHLRILVCMNGLQPGGSCRHDRESGSPSSRVRRVAAVTYMAAEFVDLEMG